MDNQPQLVGITDKTNQIGENVILYGRTASPYNFRDVTTTTTTLPDKPKEKIYTLDLKDSFFYDCPNMIGCGKQNGSNEQPLTDEKELKRIKGMGRLLASLKDFPIIFKTNFYLIGYASSENDQKAIVQGGLTRYQHNLQLSEERAQFVADNLIESFEANGGETLNIQVEGKGPTDKFAKGNDNESLKQNRRVMLTNNPNSLTPIKIKVTYDDRWNPINVELIQ
jgi:hypothetical protein